MFDEKIDVAAIMREIKAGVIGKQDDQAHPKYFTDEIDRITDFIVNVKNESVRYQDIGSCLPACKRFPAFIAFFFRAAARVIRKSVSFIIRDQIVFNHNTTDMVQALMERDDRMLELGQEQRKELQDRVALLEEQRRELQDRAALLEEQSKELQDRVAILEQEAGKLRIKIADNCGIAEEVFDADQYVRFENRFRGEAQEVRAKLDYYINNYVEEADGPMRNAIDIGCGRGEWIQLMNEKGYRTIGVDINAAMVQECTERGLHAVCDDAVAYLSKAESESVSVVSAFQVIEHMPKTKVLQLITEARRVLMPHGLLLLETPNIQNMEVGASSFYLDPTHRNPMHPELLLFMSEIAGFQGAQIVYWNKDSVEEWMREMVEQDNTHALDSAVVRTILQTLKEKIYISPDYALVAKR